MQIKHTQVSHIENPDDRSAGSDRFLTFHFGINIVLLKRSGCSAGGSALDWGSRGRRFESCYSDEMCAALGSTHGEKGREDAREVSSRLFFCVACLASPAGRIEVFLRKTSMRQLLNHDLVKRVDDMRLQFIFGAAGAGKTEYVLRQFLTRAPQDFRKKWFLIVPEQDTLAMQRKILSHPDNRGGGILNIDVLSFDRLAYRVFEELHLPAMTIIDDTGKIMILRSVTEKLAGRLTLYRRELDKPGFLERLKSQISEFYQYHITPELLDLTAEHAASAYTRSKLSDIALIYEQFQAYMEAHGYHTQEEVLDRLYEHLPESRLLQDAVAAFDGFTGFTPIQLRILEELMPAAGETWVTVDVSADMQDSVYEKRGPEDLFYLSRQTVAALTDLAGKLQVPVMPAIDVNRFDARTGCRREGTTAPRFSDAPALSVIEQQLYRVSADAPAVPCDHSVAIWEAADLRQEAEAIAACIERSIREKGYRYQEIGIVLTDPEKYRDVIYKVFSEAEIPYFFDDPASLLDSPYAELMRAALEAVDRGFSFDTVLRFLRALPAMSAERQQHIDLLDNYLRATGIRGVAGFSKEWTDLDGRINAMESIRQELITPLLHLRENSGARGATVAVRAAALETLLQEIGAREAMSCLTEELRAEGEQNRAEALNESVKEIDRVLQQLTELLGDMHMSRSGFRDVLDAGLRQASVRVIPATIDQVVIGDLTRSRFSNPRLFFVAGLTADEVPKAEADTKLLTDRDRSLFASLSIELAPDRMENALVQRFYIYRALLNPSERLVLSYALKGRDGKGSRPSGLIRDILRMFTDLHVQKLRYQAPQAYTMKEAARYIAAALQEETLLPALLHTDIEAPGAAASANADGREAAADAAGRFLRFLAVLDRDPAEHTRVQRLLDAAFTCYEETALSKHAAEALYGSPLCGSITRFENYSRCAYQHFLHYGLQLQERESFELQLYDIGNLYHTALERGFRQLLEEKKRLEDLDEDALRDLAVQNVRHAAENYHQGLLMDTARNQYLVHKATEVTRTTMWALAEQLRRGEFHVDQLERSFDYVREGMRLTGRIDRVDIASDEGHVYVKIIDYKSGKTSFDLTRIYNGTQLQLTTYMNVAMNAYKTRFPDKEVVPAAMFYYRMDDPVLDYEAGQSAEELVHERLQKLRVDGLVNTELSVVQKLDRDIERNADILPVTIKSGAVDATKKNVASTKRFRDLGVFVEEKLKRYAQEIRDGRIGIHPIEMSSDTTACTWCPYHSVCRFDPRIDGYKYRTEAAPSAAEIWNEISPEERDHAVDDGTGKGN